MFDISAGPFREWMPTIITGLFSMIVVLATIQSKKGAELRGRDFERERADKIETERLREAEMTTGANQAQDLTQRFRMLMEGYENRIKDLTSELALRKAEHDRLERLYDERQLLCNACPTYLDHLRLRDARPTS
jgi:hypothetical protein